MTTLYQTTRESKTPDIEEAPREETPFRLVITLKKLGVVTMLDYFISPEEAQAIVKVLTK